jgi:hypothetical protein
MTPSEQPPGPPSEGPPSSPSPGTPPPAYVPSLSGPATASDVTVSDPSGPPSPDYPASIEISYPNEMNRWLPLVKWLLIIPHLVVLFFVGIAAFFVAIYAFFAVLFTGRWPRGAFDFLVGTLRWAYRVTVYAYLMVDPYPPFTLDDDPDYPVRLNIDYPERIANWRPLVHWLLILPYLFVAGVLLWLTGLLAVIAFFTILFTKQIPRGLFELMVPGLRWNLRGSAYAYFMSDRYPPWEWG